MDIFEWAKENNYLADYYDHNTGYIYGVSEYGRCKKFGLPTYGIPIYDQDHKLIGYVRE